MLDKKHLLALLLMFLSISALFAQAGYIPVADCEPPKSSAYLDINNVRAKILGSSDMWWDLEGAPEYEVPKGSGKHPFFAGALWVGGKDANDQLHVMGHRYRMSGITAYPGPLVTGNSDAGTTTAEVCHAYDQLYKINREQVETFRKWYNCKQNPDCNTEAHFPGYAIPDEILNWPAHGPAGGYAYYLAPFRDVNNDGVYNPYDGDFPYFEFPQDGITDNPDCIDIPGVEPKLYGDQTIWQVFNDSGNDDGDTGSEPLGFEFHAQAYAYATNDVLNDQTFYHYRMINRSTNAYHDLYIGFWTDADLGGPRDDYVGCDVSRGLGYHYNGDDVDEDDGSSLGYGDNPPAAGIDFVAGPYKNKNHKDDPSNWVITEDGNRQIDCDAADFMNDNINGQNFEDGIVDNERLGMQHFLYFHLAIGYPPFIWTLMADDYYEYLTGYWHDGTHLKYGGIGHQSDISTTNVNTMFMFPGDPTTDPCGWGQNGQVMPGWSEETEENGPYDRRYVISTGPISMDPGAVNDFTIAALYGRAFKGSAWESVKALKRVDDAVQAMFDRCFRVLDGPDDPALNIVELDGKLVLQIMNDITSNNYLESYKERDPKIPGNAVDNNDEKYYHFQGYQVFQLKDENVDFWENRYDTTKVKAIFQCDIKDDVENLINYKFNPESDALDEQLEVKAANGGIVHSFELTTDAFPWGDDDKLVNHKTLHFVAKAYASNQWNVFSHNDPGSFSGQTEPYLTGRKKPVIYKGTAHKNLPENQGTVLFSDYGDGVEITQMGGHGNGNNLIDLTEASIETIMSGSPWKDTTPTYQQGRGPVDVKVIDPLNVEDDTYTLEFINANVNYYGMVEEGADWILVNADYDTIDSDHAITKAGNEQLLLELGLSISIAQVSPAAYKNQNPNRNGFLEASIAFEEPDKPWLSFVPDGDKFDAFNWIRVGTYYDGNFMSPNLNYDDYLGMDPDEYYEDILGGTWAPIYLTSTFKYGPCFNRSQMNIDKYGLLSSVDIVITDDKSKWTRCVVLEMCENEWTTDEYGQEVEVDPLVNYLSEGNALRFDLRQHPSVDKYGDTIPGDTTHGLSWFPGYAIDVRTGERLNMAFGEDSWLAGDNGNDMMWNPSSSVYDSLNGPRFGGKHYIYVFGHTNYVFNPEISTPAYDSCKWIYNKMCQYEENESVMYKKWALSGAMWTAIPYINDDCDLLETDVKIRIRVATPYFYRDYPPEDTIRDKPCKYVFNTTNIQTMTQNSEVAESALDLIRVVPNPYYGYSYYESSRTRCVKITNLPQICTISIFNVSGTLVQRFTKSDDMPWLEWDLNDQSGKRIGGGMYIIHIDAPEIGEKVVKWFGAISE